MRIETIGDATLYLGDCLEILPTLGPVDAVVTDPPYGIGYQHGGGGIPVSKRNSWRRFEEPITGDDIPFDPRPFLAWPCVIFGADHFCDKLTTGGTFHWWDKAYSGGPDDSFSDAEVFWTSWQRKRIVIRHLWKGVCQDSEKGLRKVHPSQKPIRVIERCIDLIPDAETILDPFMGSGTTGVACANLGRKFIGIEIEEKYFDIACRRIETAYLQPRLFEGEPARPQPQELPL